MEKNNNERRETNNGISIRGMFCGVASIAMWIAAALVKRVGTFSFGRFAEYWILFSFLCCFAFTFGLVGVNMAEKKEDWLDKVLCILAGLGANAFLIFAVFKYI